MTITRLNPDTLHKNPAFTQVVTVVSPKKLIYVGGQNGVDVEGKIVGKDIASQSAEAFKNLLAALEAAGATMQDVFKMTIYIVQGHSLQDAFAATQQAQLKRAEPPIVTFAFVAGLANPDYLIEIEAIAAIG